MDGLKKCLLLPIDGTEESIRPIHFIGRLYPDARDINLVVSYFTPPLPPLYVHPESKDLQKRKRELLDARERDTRAIFARAREILLKAGFSADLIQEHVQEKQLSVARHSCLLAGIKKVDAVVVQKKVSSGLEGFLRDESASALLQHCLASPIWFTDGDIEPSRAAVCILDEETAFRIADHMGFMLAGANVDVTLLHAARSISRPLRSPAFAPHGSDLLAWLRSSAGRVMVPYLSKCAAIFRDAGVEEDRIEMALIPGRSNAALDILTYCQSRGIGIVGLGHSEPEGTWSFLKASVTKKVLTEFKNMAVWVSQ
jgi:hypothetical protein